MVLRPFKRVLLAVLLAAPGHAWAADEKPVKLIVGAFASPGSPWDKDWQTFRKNLDATAGDRVAPRPASLAVLPHRLATAPRMATAALDGSRPARIRPERQTLR